MIDELCNANNQVIFTLNDGTQTVKAVLQLLEGSQAAQFCWKDNVPEASLVPMLKLLTQQAKANGLETLFCTVPLSLVKEYEACGFCRCSVVENTPQGDVIRMAKSLPLDGIDWITFTDAPQVVLYRNVFTFPQDLVCVTLDILTHGFSEVYLNGTRISDDYFTPAWTNYNAQDFSTLSYPLHDTFCHRSLFLHYDLTENAKEGVNAFAVHIGDGWYGQRESRNEGIRPYGEKKLCFCLTVQTKSGATRVFTSADGGFFCPSYITRSSMYFGETHDYRIFSRDYFTSDLHAPAFRPVKTASRPYTLMQRQTFSGDRILRRITSVEALSVFGDRVIYDIGENVAGFAELRFSPQASNGDRVIVRYAENLNDDGSLNFHSTGGTNRLSVDVFCCGEKSLSLAASLTPHFLWHAGRYVEVTGKAELISFCVVASAVPVTAEFQCSDPVLNWLFDAYIRTQQSNIHTLVPSDCPHRERLGYTGDGQLTAAAVMTTFDAKTLYQKWMCDIADCQDIYNGHVQHTAPFYGGGGGPGGWGCAIVEIPYRYWKFYGDASVLTAYYPNMLKYLDYMAAHCEANLVVREEPKGWCLGDWCTPHNGKVGVPIPEPFVNTYFYIRSLRQVMEVSVLLGKTVPLALLRQREADAVSAICSEFFDSKTGSFCGGVCGADAFAVDLGLGDERTLMNLVEHYRNTETFDTGIFGTPLVVKVLFENGYADEAVQLLANRGEVSFYHMMQSGATTLWEEWFNEHSSSHPMFGAVVEYLFSYILGIRQARGSVGFTDVEIAPCAARTLSWAQGSVVLGNRRISVRVENGALKNSEIIPL